MEHGMYRPIRYRWWELYRPWNFTNITQFWLALLSFSLFIVTLLWTYMWEWWEKMNLSPLAWVAYVFGSIVVTAFLVLAMWSLVSFIVVLVRSWVGVRISYDKKAIAPEVERAIEGRFPTPKHLVRAINEILSGHSRDQSFLLKCLTEIIAIEKELIGNDKQQLP